MRVMVKDLTEGKLLLVLWLCSATLVTVIRFLHAGGPGYDLALQIQATHNLLAGHGLSLYEHMGPDLADRASLVTLTYFPPGYSLIAAALLSAGFGVGMTVKVMGAAATMLGWWGWGRLAHPFLDEGMTNSSVWRWAGIAIATFTPLLFTPSWAGTDIFLWAVVPWVVDFAVRASDENAPGTWRPDWLAGALCGLALLMRYCSPLL